MVAEVSAATQSQDEQTEVTGGGSAFSKPQFQEQKVRENILNETCYYKWLKFRER